MKRFIALFMSVFLLLSFCACSAPSGKNKADDTEKTEIEGLFLRGKTSDFIINEACGPVILETSLSRAEIPDTLKSGDRIKVTCSLIRETYPASTDLYGIELIEEGDISDIGEAVISSLSEMGWL